MFSSVTKTTRQIDATELVGEDADVLYGRLCALSGLRHDPCVIDVFLSIVRFMDGGPAQPWWAYTAERKHRLRTAD
jgi:hypothetical protein